MALYKLPNNLQLVGISGHAGAGKDELAKMLYSTYVDTYSEAMAGSLKLACAHLFGMPDSDFHDPESKESINPYWGVSPRMMAQFVGTELFREHVWKLLRADLSDFWVKRMYGRLSGFQRHETDGDYVEGDTVIIPDIRFAEEVNFIEMNEGVHIHLTRNTATGEVGIANHPSEALNFSLTGRRTYVVTNNGTIEELYDKVNAIVTANLSLTPYEISI